MMGFPLAPFLFFSASLAGSTPPETIGFDPGETLDAASTLKAAKSASSPEPVPMHGAYRDDPDVKNRRIVMRYLSDHAADFEPATIFVLGEGNCPSGGCPKDCINVPQAFTGSIDGAALLSTERVASCVAVAINSASGRSSLMHMDQNTNVEKALKDAAAQFSDEPLTVRLYTSPQFHPKIVARALKYMGSKGSLKVKEVSLGTRGELYPDGQYQFINVGINGSGRIFGFKRDVDSACAKQSDVRLPRDSNEN